MRALLEQHIRNSDYRAALEISLQLHDAAKSNAEIAAMHGHVLQQLGMHDEARPVLEQASTKLPKLPSIWIDLANACIAKGDWNAADSAIARFRALAPASGAGLFAEAEVQAGRGRRDRADILFRQACSTHPYYIERRLNLAGALLDKKQFEVADWHYLACTAQHPESQRAHLDYLASLFQQGKYRAAATLARAALRRWPNNLRILQRFSVILDLVKDDPAERAAVRAEWVRQAPDSVDAHLALANALVALEDFTSAHRHWRQAQALDPAQPLARWTAMHFPEQTLFRTDQDVQAFRSNWISELAYFESAPTPDPSTCLRMIQGSAGHRLIYVCEDALEPMQRYGRQMARICDRAFATTPPHRVEPVTRKRRRIGVVSSNFGWHSVSRVWRDLMLGVERETLELVCFKLDDGEDASTAEWRRGADVFIDTQGDLPHWIQCIAAADLDVLIFLDLGPNTVGYALATRRFAPVQCTTWAFPATSGLATIDYFLSSDLMEPNAEVARTHYLETLVRLPGLACSYAPHEALAKVAASAAPRREAGLQFLCTQSHFKLLPAHDALFARVLAATPGSLLSLSHGGGEQVSAALSLRMEPILTASGIDADARLRAIAQMPYSQFLELLATADVVLDSLMFCGCLTSLDALSLDLPIVTLPGNTLRGRQTAAMLELLDVPELIAKDEDDYVRIASRLAQEPGWRQTVRRQIAANKHRLYDIGPSVRGLEEFLRTIPLRS